MNGLLYFWSFNSCGLVGKCRKYGKKEFHVLGFLPLLDSCICRLSYVGRQYEKHMVRLKNMKPSGSHQDLPQSTKKHKRPASNQTLVLRPLHQVPINTSSIPNFIVKEEDYSNNKKARERERERLD